MKKYYTKKQYTESLKLWRTNIFTRKGIAEKLGINFHTLDEWFYTNKRPHCISKKWKERNKLVYKNLGDYTKPNKVYIPKLKNSPGLAYLIGVYLGDGNSYEGFDMVSIDYEFANKVAKIISKIAGREITPKFYKRVHKNRKEERGFRVRLSSVILKEYLERVTNNKKIIPKVIFKSDDNIKWELFSGFLDSEGSINYDSKDKNSGRISISQKGKKLLLQFKKLLVDFSIKSGIVVNHKNYFNLNIYGKYYFKIIHQRGGFIQPRKNIKLVQLLRPVTKNPRIWTKKEEMFLLGNKDKGYNYIATRLNRSYNSVASWYNTKLKKGEQI